MQKLNTNNPNSLIFEPVSERITSAIKEDSVCLHANVFLNKECTQQIRLAMTNFYLAICSSHHQFSQYLFATELQFALKFQVIFELDGKVQQQHSIFSKKIGFRLFKQGAGKVEFFFKSQPLLEIWLRYLAKNLNQYGFHKLYKPIRKLGTGGFATVYEIERVTDKQRFAAKAFSKSATILSANPTNKLVLLNQIQMLRTFDSPNIMKLEGVFESDNSIYIILELLADGQLHSKINEKAANFTQQEIKQFMRGLARGLSEIHKYRVMHRDIKPENIMLRGKDGLEPVIVDFGLAADVDSDDYIYKRCGTPGYVAPEITTYKQGDKLTPECDIFSAGCIFHILLVKRTLFEGKQCAEVYENNKKCSFNLNSSIYKKVDGEAMDLLRRMLKVNASERITAEEMLQHPFLSEGMEIENSKVVSPATTMTSNKTLNFMEAEYTL